MISGHEGPVSCLSYSPVEDLFVSGSWDRNVKVHNVLGKKARTETLNHSDKILSVSFRPDGKELCVSTFRGEMYFWDIEADSIKGLIDGARDLKSGRGQLDHQEAKNQVGKKNFRTYVYTVISGLLTQLMESLSSQEVTVNISASMISVTESW